MLRTSMSNREQELLFNDIISPFGVMWLDKKNDYIRKYKVFKNICFYNCPVYSPRDFLKDEYPSLTDEELKDYFDIYEYLNPEKKTSGYDANKN